ncbi:hypothetical protein IWQ57_006770, partial [Coemansia nantahalensis]
PARGDVPEAVRGGDAAAAAAVQRAGVGGALLQPPGRPHRPAAQRVGGLHEQGPAAGHGRDRGAVAGQRAGAAADVPDALCAWQRGALDVLPGAGAQHVHCARLQPHRRRQRRLDRNCELGLHAEYGSGVDPRDGLGRPRVGAAAVVDDLFDRELLVGVYGPGAVDPGRALRRPAASQHPRVEAGRLVVRRRGGRAQQAPAHRREPAAPAARLPLAAVADLLQGRVAGDAHRGQHRRRSHPVCRPEHGAAALVRGAPQGAAPVQRRHAAVRQPRVGRLLPGLRAAHALLHGGHPAQPRDPRVHRGPAGRRARAAQVRYRGVADQRPAALVVRDPDRVAGHEL